MTYGKEPIVPFSTTSGLTKREYFTGIALQGLLSGRRMAISGAREDKVYSELAVKIADFTIEELNKEKK